MRTPLIYLAFGIVWIFGSDALSLRLTRDPQALTDFQNFKGVIFVGLSALLILLLEKSDERRREKAARILRDSEERFRATFEQAAIGMAHVAPDGRWLRVNNKLCEITGYGAGELTGGMTFQQITHADDVEIDVAQARDLLDGRITNFAIEKRYWRKDGTLIWAQITVSLARANGAPPYFIAAIEDITQRKATEAEIASLNATLDLRVRERTAQLAHANRDLESFSYSVSHDLRAPLRAVNGFAQIVARRYAAVLNDEAQHYLENILQASARMNLLIDDLLKYSRLGRHAVLCRDVDLQVIFAQVQSDLADKIGASHAQIEFATPVPTLPSDATLLRQIFTNLIDNALKYHAPGVAPHIVISCGEEGSEFVLRVRDNGVGIPAEYREKVFNAFQRLHPDEHCPGTGIGLAIVARAASLLGGSVTLEESQVNISDQGIETTENKTISGSTFAVRLPKTIVPTATP